MRPSIRFLALALAMGCAGCHWALPLAGGGLEQSDGGDGQVLDGASLDRSDPGDGSPPGDGPFQDSDRSDGATPALPPIYRVTADGWGQRLPLFRNGGSHIDVAAIWGSGLDDIWAVGQDGTVIHNRGKGWRQVISGTTEDLEGVWGISGQLWIVGANGTALHFDGHKLSPLAVGTTSDLISVSGTSASNVWIGGVSGLTLRSANGGWDKLPSGAYLDAYDIHVGQTAEVWVPNVDGLRRFKNGLWGDEAFPTSSSAVRAMAGTATRPTFAATNDGKVLAMKSAGGWSVRPYTLPGAINGLFLDGSAVLWGAGTAGVYRLDASSFTAGWSDTAFDFLDIWGAASELFAVAYAGTMVHHDGKHWFELPLADVYYITDIGAVPGETWIASEEGALRDRGRGFEVVPWDSGSISTLNGIWVGDPLHVWAVGDAGLVLRYDDATQSMVTVNTPVSGKLRGVWGVVNGPVFACGQDGIIKHVNGSWSVVHTGTSLTGLWGSSASDIWAVGWAGALVHVVGGKATPVTGPLTVDILDVHGRSATDVWIVGGNGKAAHFDGTTWKPVSVPGASGALSSVWVGPKAVWVAGNDGVFVNRAGTWTKQQIGTNWPMIATWGTSDTDVWAGGEEGFLVHFDDRH